MRLLASSVGKSIWKYYFYFLNKSSSHSTFGSAMNGIHAFMNASWCALRKFFELSMLESNTPKIST